MAAAANLKLKGTTWHFRRRVPDRLRPSFRRSEIVLSLQTASAREAGFRARAVYVQLERIFRTVSDNPFADVQETEALLERLRKEKPWESSACQDLAQGVRQGDFEPVNRLVFLIAQKVSEMSPEELENVTGHMQRLNETAAVHNMEKKVIRANIEKSLTEVSLLKAESENQKLLSKLEEQPASQKQTKPAAAPASCPIFSKLQQDFLTWKRTQAGWTAHSEAQAAGTFRLAVEILGDKPVRDYQRTDAGQLYDQLLRLPKTHGKGAARGKAITAVAAIARADEAEKAGKTVDRIQLKTVKRHFSALLQYWKWLKQRGHAEDLIWSGFSFPGTKSSKKKRDAWSDEDLAKLFASDWWGPQADRESVKYWVPLIALHSGMRLEEICRLRPQDVEKVSDIPCFNIREHPDGWSPKTESGERLVPVHSFLIERGLLDLVEKRRKAGSERVFTDLRPTGDDGKLGQAFGREFGRLKTKLGVGPKTVFHSFRHTFRTALESTDLPERWIDAVMGHEDQRRSEGARTYAKGVAVERLREVIEGVHFLVKFRGNAC